MADEVKDAAAKDTPVAAADDAAKKTDSQAADDTAAAKGDDTSKGAKGVTDDKAKPAEGDKTEPKTEERKAPDRYDLKVPEDSTLDLRMVEKIARKYNLSNDETQILAEQQDIYLRDQNAEYLGELRADKDYGGDKLEETQRLVEAAIDKVRPKGGPKGDGFRNLLKGSGYRNHKEVAAFFADLGKMLREDSGTGGTGSNDGPDKPLAQRLYPNAKS